MLLKVCVYKLNAEIDAGFLVYAESMENIDSKIQILSENVPERKMYMAFVEKAATLNEQGKTHFVKITSDHIRTLLSDSV